MEISASIDIQAPIEKVFTVFSDLSKLEDRVQGIQAIEVLEGPLQMEVGTKWKETRIFFGKEATEIMWVTALNPSHNYVVEAESNGTKYRSEYTFTETDTGTQVAMTFSGKPQTFIAKLFGLLFAFMAGSLKKTLIQDLEDLKVVCES